MLADLRDAGRKALTEAMLLALGDEPPSPEMLAALSDAITENDRYLENSLMTALRDKLTAALTDPDILAAAALGVTSFRAALRAMLDTSAARVASYAGAWWTIYNRTLGLVSQQKSKPVRAYLDPRAQHCDECPKYASSEGREYPSFVAYLRETGGRVPGEFECGTNCRCELR